MHTLRSDLVQLGWSFDTYGEEHIASRGHVLFRKSSESEAVAAAALVSALG